MEKSKLIIFFKPKIHPSLHMERNIFENAFCELVTPHLHRRREGMSAIHHVFWDWNGTLLNDAWLCQDVMNRMLEARGMAQLSAERYREIFDFPIEGYYERIGFDFQKESFLKLGQEFMDGYEIRRMEASLYPDTRTGLETVEMLGLGQSILSAYRRETLVTLVEAHELTSFFHDVSGHEHIYPVGKTPQGREALERLNLDPARTILIGDTVHDADVAAELGMQCVLVNGGNQPIEKLQSAGVPVVQTRMEALAEVGILGKA